MVTVANIVCLFIIVTSGIFGLLFNASLGIMVTLKSDIRKDYSVFIIGMATLNVIYCINVSVLQPITILGSFDSDGPVCQFTGFTLIMCAICSLLTQPLLALNRYSAVFHGQKHKELFSRRNISVMLVLVYSISFGLALSFYFLKDYGRFVNTICCLDIGNMPIFHIIGLFLIPLSVGYSITVFCAIKISRYLKRHEKQMDQREILPMLKETKQIVKLIYLDLCIPLVLECPPLAMCILLHYVNVEPVIIALTVGCFVLHATTDPIVVVLVVKPYRLETKRLINKLRANIVKPASVQPSVSYNQNGSSVLI